MPIYEYRCDACGVELEKIQKFSDAPLKDCPECGKPALQKLISASAFRLKGSGWYETDFKTGKKKNVAGEGGGASSPSSSSSSKDKPAASPKASSDGAKSGAGKGEGKASSAG